MTEALPPAAACQLFTPSAPAASGGASCLPAAATCTQLHCPPCHWQEYCWDGSVRRTAVIPRGPPARFPCFLPSGKRTTPLLSHLHLSAFDWHRWAPPGAGCLEAPSPGTGAHSSFDVVFAPPHGLPHFMDCCLLLSVTWLFWGVAGLLRSIDAHRLVFASSAVAAAARKQPQALRHLSFPACFRRRLFLERPPFPFRGRARDTLALIRHGTPPFLTPSPLTVVAPLAHALHALSHPCFDDGYVLLLAVVSTVN